MSLQTNTVQRRFITVPAVGTMAVVLTLALPLWVPLTVAADLLRGKWRCPTTRLLSFGVCWAWLETAGVTAAAALWLTGQRRNTRLHYALQRWWSKNMLASLGATCGITVDARHVDVLSPGRTLLFVRHASLADSLLTAYVATDLAGLHPRFVLKRELLLDPCLDVVGHRIRNHFLDRGANDSASELSALSDLVHDLGDDDVGIIFPEGTRASPAKRVSALRRISDRDPDRAARLSTLHHLLPPRPGGARAMVTAAPDADVVLAWHVGFEGMDSFRGILEALNRRLPPIRFEARRVPSSEVPRDQRFEGWLDDQWVQMDAEVSAALNGRERKEFTNGQGHAGCRDRDRGPDAGDLGDQRHRQERLDRRHRLGSRVRDRRLDGSPHRRSG